MCSLPAIAESIDEHLRTISGSCEKKDLYAEFNRLSTLSEPGAGGFLINPLNRPGEDQESMLEMTEHHHFARGLMEGCVYLMRERIENLVSAGIKKPERIVLVGGPTNSPIWPQILSDVLGVSVEIPESGRIAWIAFRRKGKPYQVKQIRNIISLYKLHIGEDDV